MICTKNSERSSRRDGARRKSAWKRLPMRDKAILTLSGDQKRAKTSHLRSEGRKSSVQRAHSAQKCHFCAREAGKVPSGSPKARKKPGFALERPEKCRSEGPKRAKLSLLRSERRKMALRKAHSAQKPNFCARKARIVLFEKPKARKNLTFALGRRQVGMGK